MIPVLVNPITGEIRSSIPSEALKNGFEGYVTNLSRKISERFHGTGGTLKDLADSIYLAMNPLTDVELYPRPYDELDLTQKIPADTRAGLNDHSLFAHSCLTSVIAACMGWSKKVDLNALRVAALLHDIGKLYDWKDHIGKGVEASRAILETTLPKYQDEISRLIAAHSGDGNPSQVDERILRDANISALKAERELKMEFFGSDVVDEDNPNYEMKSKENVLRFYTEFKKKKRVELEKKSEVVLLSADVRAIDKYVERVRNLPSVRGGSFLVRKASEQLRGYIARRFGPEFVVYCGGGALQAILPPLGTAEMESIEQELKDVFAREAPGSELTCEWERFSIDDICLRFNMCRDRLARKLDRKKKEETIKFREILGPLCEWCMERPATKRIEVEEKSVCGPCFEKYHRGKSEARSQRETVRRELRTRLEIPVDLDALTEHDDGHDDLAIIRGDGNLVGRFFAGALSPAHLTFMSLMVDSETCRAVWKVMERVEKSASADGRKHLPLDIVYVGGDQFLFLVSARYLLDSLELMASSLEEGFRKADGTVALTYAFSAITCNYKYPLYEAFYISETLLHKNKEKRARSDPPGKNRTWVWFEPIGSATLTESDIKAFRERFAAEIKPKTLTDKPLTWEEISEIREVSKRLGIKRSSLHNLLELCMRERPSVFPFIRNQVGRHVWSEEEAKLIGKYVEAGKILDFMEVYELEIGRG